MNGNILRFFLSGAIAGLATAAIGESYPIMLTAGGGGAFYVALIGAIISTRGSSRHSSGLWRYLLGACIAIASYVLAIFTFSIVGGFSPQVLGIQPSSDIMDLGPDVIIGVASAALLSAICAELLAFTLTGRWSSKVLILLIFSAFLTIAASFGTKLFVAQVLRKPIYYQAWAVLVILFVAGDCLFCGLIGSQILHHEVAFSKGQQAGPNSIGPPN